MKDFIISMFTGPVGDISSKRMLAFILIINGIVYLFIKGDALGAGTLLGSGTSLLIAGAITKS